MSARSPLPSTIAAVVLFACAGRVQAELPAPKAASPVADGVPAPAQETASGPVDWAQTQGSAPPPAALTPVAAVPPRALVAAPVPEKPARVPLAKRWWFWASLGAAAVGVVLGAIYLGPKEPYTGNATPGILRL